ncbi:hypothetical protein HanRHA438_Chr15g0727171 [Helianthus annuus]|nr:hypothetical protein HanRHA438_Chr15g0727171 [Helianthus annuus]
MTVTASHEISAFTTSAPDFEIWKTECDATCHRRGPPLLDFLCCSRVLRCVTDYDDGGSRTEVATVITQ